MRIPRASFCRRVGLFVLLAFLTGRSAIASEGPRIVNIYNFIRNSDFRITNSEDVLFECTRQQIDVLKRLKLPATWALQYDALMNPRYQKLLKQEMGNKDEIAAWWEIPQPLAEKAGLKWRGRHEWDPEADVGFSPGYTPEERRKLVDVYMADFKRIFGRYPKTAGSWYIDEVTLAYMGERYHVIASCNCKDQIGTDFYTLWGGYWNQAYYPSRLNAYMPAQTRKGQIDVPIFRMLGSDPIYQHGITPGMFTMEPVYPNSGGSSNWVNWYVGNFVHQTALAIAFTQVGQENSFGWDAMKDGFERQMELFAKLARSGEIQVDTLAQAGSWFRRHFSTTPATSVVALVDWKHQDRKTVWYDSRFYRLNIIWEDGAFFIRDLHCFDENIVSPTHEKPLRASSLSYETLPIMDWARWSEPRGQKVGMWPVLLLSDGNVSPMIPEGAPIVTCTGSAGLKIQQSLRGGGEFAMVCTEDKITFTAYDENSKPLRWAWNFVGDAKQKAIVQSIEPSAITYAYIGNSYKLRLQGFGSCRQLSNGDIQIAASDTGMLVLRLGGVLKENK